MKGPDRLVLWLACGAVLLRDSYPAACDLWDFLCYTGVPHLFAQVGDTIGRLFH